MKLLSETQCVIAEGSEFSRLISVCVCVCVCVWGGGTPSYNALLRSFREGVPVKRWWPLGMDGTFPPLRIYLRLCATGESYKRTAAALVRIQVMVVSLTLWDVISWMECTVMRRITTFRSTTDRLYDGGTIILYNNNNNNNTCKLNSIAALKNRHEYINTHKHNRHEKTEGKCEQ